MNAVNALRAYIYHGSTGVTVECDFISHGNAVEPLTVHRPVNPEKGDVYVQAKPGQSFVLNNGFLVCYQDGHEVLPEEAEIVFSYPSHLHEIASCPECRDVYESDRRP